MKLGNVMYPSTRYLTSNNSHIFSPAKGMHSELARPLRSSYARTGLYSSKKTGWDLTARKLKKKRRRKETNYFQDHGISGGPSY